MKDNPNIAVTIAILSFNTKDLLRSCLNSIFKYTKGLEFEVIVVDNASHDGSAGMVRKIFPNVELIVNKKNLFFAGGYNIALKNAKGEYFIMLNSDTYIKNNAFKRIIDWMGKNSVEVCEGLELDWEGNVINTGSKFPSPLTDFYELSLIGKRIANDKKISDFRLTKKDRRRNFQIDVGCNAFFCVKKDILNQIQGFDENFKLYYTENDICRRIKQRGYKIYHCGESFIYHKIAASTSNLKSKRIKQYLDDLNVYYVKTKNINGVILYYLLVIEYIFLRFIGKV